MDFFLGGPLDDAGDRLPDAQTNYDASDLTTHGVIVGMTGSGKTGLGVIFLEEALRNDVPTLVIDPKGDMTNLLLTFPDLAPSDFRPWIDEAAAEREGVSPDEEAAAEAAKWEKGLGWWNLGGDDIRDLRDRSGMAIYTPGSRAGIPLDIVGDLSAPDLSWEEDTETLRDEIQGFASGLLGLVDIDADPVSSREHILVSNLIENAWRAEQPMSLETLIGQIATPPIRKLGVFDIDTFFPAKDRMAFAMKLNSLLASPSFGTWMEGEPLDIENLLWRDGKPQAAIIYLAHLSDSERQFIVTTLFSKLITWMRSQSGSSELRALAYMDEVFGFVPPTAEPPAKKPILTVLKQARAFGIGLLLSTQNPVDLDYKAMSNAGTWCIGRLQTERDKARILEALNAASGDIDISSIDTKISGLAKRSFILHNTREKVPELFTTRWAMSYLRGPMTRDEVERVTDYVAAPTPDIGVLPHAGGGDVGAADRGGMVAGAPIPTSEPPDVADGVQSVAVHPAAVWAQGLGNSGTGETYEAGIAVTVEMRFDERRVGVDHVETWEAVAFPAPTDAGSVEFAVADHDDRDWIPLDGSSGFAETSAPLGSSSYFEALERALEDDLHRNETIEVLRSTDPKLTSRPGEDEAAFRSRVAAARQEQADAEMAKLRSRYESRLRTAKRRYDDAVRTADTAAAALDQERSGDMLGMGLDLLMGRKPRVSRSRTRTAETRLRKAEDKIESARRAYEDLTLDLEDEIRAIQAKADQALDDIETITIGLEKDDIRTTDIRVFWVKR